ncbi:50S ribosomal protein L30 [Neoactinobaculum massilliense]|uniref:50S ribosomal protein L30 n=1 Tax=Neoactinobaculum massilliense TaxID=2364794 RepID=UPI000F542539|nr:50S ribosomal protein L30 [Neoactinobaculum massilliense]
MAKLKITQIKGVVGTPKRQRATVLGIGLHRIGDSVVREDTPDVRGMIRAVAHLVEVEEVD